MPLLSRCGVGPQWHCCVKATASSLCTKRRGRPPQTPGDVTNRAFEGLPRGFWVGRWTSSGGPAVVQQCLLRPFTRTAAWRRPTRQQWGHCQPAAVAEDPLRACFIRLHPARRWQSGPSAESRRWPLSSSVSSGNGVCHTRTLWDGLLDREDRTGWSSWPDPPWRCSTSWPTRCAT